MESETLGDDGTEETSLSEAEFQDESVVVYCSPSHEAFLTKLAEHEYATKSKFNLRTSTKKVADIKAALTKPSTRLKVQWLGNVPYIWLQTIKYVCHQGRDVNRSGKRKYAQMRDSMEKNDHILIRRNNKRQAIKKVDCPARVRVKRIVRFMNYKLKEFTERNKRITAASIKQALVDGTDLGEECFIYNLPMPEDHENHTLEGSAEPVDRRIRKFIKDLVIKGRRDIGGIAELTYAFAEHNLKEYDRSRSRFYPRRSIIRGIVALTKKKIEQSSINQEDQVFYFNDDMDVGEIEMETGNDFATHEVVIENEIGDGSTVIELETVNGIDTKPNLENFTEQPEQLNNKQHLVGVMNSTMKSIRTTMKKLDETSLLESVEMMQNVLQVMESKIPNHAHNALPTQVSVETPLYTGNVNRIKLENNKERVLLENQGQRSQVGVKTEQDGISKMSVARIIFISNKVNEVVNTFSSHDRGVIF